MGSFEKERLSMLFKFEVLTVKDFKLGKLKAGSSGLAKFSIEVRENDYRF